MKPETTIYGGCFRRQLYSYHVTVDYRTKGGRCSTWSGHVIATNIKDAQEIARERIAHRKSTLKIDGGSAQEWPGTANV